MQECLLSSMTTNEKKILQQPTEKVSVRMTYPKTGCAGVENGRFPNHARSDQNWHALNGATWLPCTYPYSFWTIQGTTPSVARSKCSEGQFRWARKSIHWGITWHYEVCELMMLPSRCIEVLYEDFRCFSLYDKSAWRSKWTWFH